MIEAEEQWPLRAWLLAGLGAVAGLAISTLVDEYGWTRFIEPWREALALAIGTGGIALAVTLDRRRVAWAAAFSLAAGVVLGLVFWWSGGERGLDASPWPLASGFVAVALAAPLFQVARDAGASRFPYPAVHDHAWTNVVLFAAAGLFVGISWLLVFLLSELFSLIGIEALRHIAQKSWFGWMLTGAAFGGGVALMRERAPIVRLVRRVASAVLAVLAPVLAVGLVAFVLALPFTGLAPLWEATRDTTPVVLGCAIAALVLMNVVIGDTPEEEPRNLVLRVATAVLALVLLPLILIGAISIGLRIAQHGFTPERLWALTFVAIAGAYALAALVDLLIGRRGWTVRMRRSNLRLAFGFCALLLLLATPIVPFNAISTRDQVARLRSGRTPAAAFDFAALAFDFGAPGRRALAELARTGASAVRAEAAAALKPQDRWAANEAVEARRRRGSLSQVRVLPRQVPLPSPLVDAIMSDQWFCGKDCAILYAPGEPTAVVVQPSRRGVFRIDAKGVWHNSAALLSPEDPSAPAAAEQQRRALAAGDVAVRTVTRRQLYVGGKPVGEPFE